MRQNETPYWIDPPYTDEFNNQYDSSGYTLQYVFAGASAAPVTLTAAAVASGLAGQGWHTLFDAVNSALMLPGFYKWQAILVPIPASFTGTIAGVTLTLAAAPPLGQVSIGSVVTGVGVAANTTISAGNGLIWTVNNSQAVGPVAMVSTLATRKVASEGSLLVEQDLAMVKGTFDGRTTAEIGLSNAEAALVQFQASGGRVKEYSIAGRRMVFHDDKEIVAQVSFWRARVEADKQAQSGGDRRNIRLAFRRPSSGVQSSRSRNWPWW